MRLDEAILRAYLDGELPEPERERVQQYLAGSPHSQLLLAQLRAEREQVSRALDLLASPANSVSPALALKRLHTRLDSTGQVKPVLPDSATENASLTVWESPTLLLELKTNLSNFRVKWREIVSTSIMPRGLALIASLSLIILITVAALILWPALGWQPVEQGQPPTQPDVSVPIAITVPTHTPANSNTLPEDIIPIEAVFGDQIELIGYQLPAETLNSTGTQHLILYWRALRPIKVDYTVFIHVFDAEQALVSGLDSPPVQGTTPTSRWQPGQIIRDDYNLPALTQSFASREYAIVVGLYNSATGERLLAPSDHNFIPDDHSSILLARISVEGDLASIQPTFAYGIQADPSGNTQANIDHLKKIDFEWVKFQMAWKAVETSPGNYDWTMWDQVINAYAANDIKVLLSIPKAPDWARPADDDKTVEGPPADPATYAEFVTLVASRYQGKVQAIEIWNEQNLWYEAGGKGRVDAKMYVQLLKLAYQRIKAVNPDMIVISGAPAPAGNVADLAVDDIDYLKQMYAHGAKDYFDALGAHPVGSNCPALANWRTVTPEEASAKPDSGLFTNRHHSWCFLGTMEAYREVMVANGDEHKTIWPTEFGWAVAEEPGSGYEFANDNTPEEQAQWIIEAYQWAEKQGWVGSMFLWNLDFSVTGFSGTELAYFSILNRPAYGVLATRQQQSSKKVAFELKNVRQLTPCENKGQHHLFIKVQDETGQGLNGIPVEIRWGPNRDESLVIRTETKDNEPGRADFGMFEGTYAVKVQADSSQVASGLTTAFAVDEPCSEGGPGNSPDHVSFEVIFQRTASTASTLPSAPASNSTSFAYGIQAHPQGDTEANIGHLQALGFDWVKLEMVWQEVETTQGNYDWASWDNTIKAYATNDIQVLLAISKAPDWARPADDDKSVDGLPADPATYAEFVGMVASRYQDQVQAIEIWNWPNLWYEVGGRGRINAATYVQLLQQAYEAIKAANQEMIVVSGAPTPAGNVGDLAVDDIDYLNEMYAQGAKDYFDALGANPFGYNCPAMADWRTVTPEEAGGNSKSGLFNNRHHSWCFLGTMEAYREVMVANGDGGKAIWPTSFGWPVSDQPDPGHEFARDNAPEEQAQWIVEAYQWAEEQGWVGPMFLSNLDYGVVEPGTGPAYSSILNTLAYEALSASK